MNVTVIFSGPSVPTSSQGCTPANEFTNHSPFTQTKTGFLLAVIDKTVIIADRLPNGIAKNRHATF